MHGQSGGLFAFPDWVVLYLDAISMWSKFDLTFGRIQESQEIQRRILGQKAHGRMIKFDRMLKINF